MDKGEENISSFHLAGVVPISGQPLGFGFPWDDSLMAIGENYLAIERSVLECAYAGCETIWIVCNEDTQPLIKHRLGDFILDPISATNRFKKHPTEFQKQIPIFYVSIHPKDRFKRDSVAWSVLYGANSSYFVSKKISRWVTPDRYYVSFPWGVYDPEPIRHHRRTISSKKKVTLVHEDESVMNGGYLGFSFDADDFFLLRDTFKEKYKTMKKGVQDTKLEDLFCYLKPEERTTIPISWYYPIDNWEDYSTYIGSQESKELIPVSSFILKRKKLNKIPKQE
jgi:hypothetical protein|tara:strand:- start:164 stop:1006 length:843 start_codon:yes stop_codon:yes gene_type:complete